MKPFTNYKIFLIICSIFLNNICEAQNIVWQNTIGGGDDDILNSIQQTTDGGYILGGHSNSNISGDKTENNIGIFSTTDYWLVKTDSSGNIQWQNTIGGADEDKFVACYQTSDGGYILGGYSKSNASGDKTMNSYNNSYDYWMVKTDASGNIQWQKTIGGNSADYLTSIQQTSDGGYILGGYSESNISGIKTENCMGPVDYWIVKTNATGNIQWQNTIGGSSADLLISLQQTTDGGYILGGYSMSPISGDKTENCWANGYDYWIVKIDLAGNILWQNVIGGTSDDHLYSIVQTADGGYMLGGYSWSLASGDKVESSHGSWDYWIVKTDLLGNIQWQKDIGGYNVDYLQSVKQTNDGGYILGGWSNSNISGNKTENSKGGWDYWIVKTDASGSIIWQNTIGGNADDYFTSIQQTASSDYILGGFSKSTLSGDKTEALIGDIDYWVIKLKEKYNSLTGKLFIDGNSNSVQDSGEISLANKKLIESNTGRFAFSNQIGNYSVYVLDTGSFSVVPEIINHYNVIPATHTGYFPGVFQVDSLNDFALQPTGLINDLRITITPLTRFRSGFNAIFTIHYENVGTTALNASVIFYLNDSNFTYLSSSLIPALVNSNSIVWNNILLTPYQSGDITVTVHVNLGVPIGTQLNALCLINPLQGDATQGDNWGSWKVFTTGAVDPNDILVDEDTLTTAQLASNTYLEYIIRFQNTGNDTCFNAKILNPIDTGKLELNSIEFVASSHPVNLKWIPWERNMEFKFDNILLADSNINEPMSHGYIHYRIKPKSSLSAGNSILNNAAIYFDFNMPVQTNNAVTKILALVYPVASFNYLPKPPCENTSITFTNTSNNATSYHWSFQDATPATSTQTNPAVQFLSSGLKTVTLKAFNGTYTDSITIQINVGALPGATITPAVPVNLCSGESATLTANAGAGLTYQWQNNSTNIGGATSISYATTTAGNYSVVVTNSSGCVSASGVVPVNVYAKPQAVVTPISSTNICPGSSVQLQAGTGTNYTYKWKKNNTTITGATASIYTATAAGTYKVIITNANGCSNTSNSIIVTVIALTAVITPQGSLTVCNGTGVTMKANTGSGLTYQWRKGSNNIAGATDSVYTANASGTYKVIVTSTCGTKTSSGIVVTVNPLPAAVITASGPTTFCTGDSVVLTANTGSNLAYQWLKTSNNIPGATAITYIAKTATTYKVRVTNTSTGCTKSSAGLKVTVNCREGLSAGNIFDVTANPNPFTHNTTLLLSSSTDNPVTVRLMNAEGQLIKEIISKSNETITLGEQIIPGFYIAVVTNGNEQRILRLVKF